MVVPDFIERKDFFESFLLMLKNADEIKDIVSVPETFVPLIRMSVFDTKVDLVISVLATPYVPPSFDFTVPPEDLYRNMDEISIRGLAGVHLAHEINHTLSKSPLFLELLKIVRIWVRARGIGSFIQGFPANVAWTILSMYAYKQAENDPSIGAKPLAHCICKYDVQNPNMHAQEGRSLMNGNCYHSLTCLVHLFFTLFSHWSWPKPVTFGPPQRVSYLPKISWTPETNSHDLMPIITPVFPHKNVAFSVRRVTRQIVKKELKRGHEIVRSVIAGQKNWDELFKKYDIQTEYRHFLYVRFRADSQDELNTTGSFIDVNFRVLLQELEKMDCIRSTRVAPISNSADAGYERKWMVGMAIEPNPRLPDGTRARRQVDLSFPWDSFIQTLSQKDPNTNFSSKLVQEYRKRE